MRSKLLLCLLVSVLPSLTLADSDVEKLLASLRATYKSVKSAAFTVESKLQAQATMLTLKTDVLFMPTGKIYAQTTGFPPEAPMKEMTFISDGVNLVTLGLPTGENKEPYSSDKASSRMGFTNLETLSFWDYAKQLSTAKGDNMEKSTLKILPDEEMDGKKYAILEELAPEQKVLVHYWIDKKRKVIIRTVTSDMDTKEVEGDSKITKLTLDGKIDESKFTITSA